MQNSIRAIIIDDEQKSRLIIKSLLQKVNSTIEIVDEGEGVLEGVEKITTHQPDLLFLDIELADGNAFTLLEQIPNFQGKIIFITAYDQFALQAFEYAAIDYLMKPISLNQLERAISRIDDSAQLQRQKIDTLLENNGRPQQENKIIVENKNDVEFIDISTISYCEADGNYTKIHKVDTKSVLSSKTLAHFEKILPDELFFRIHHKYLINTDRMKKLKKGTNSSVVMINGKTLEVSRRKKMDFIAFLTTK